MVEALEHQPGTDEEDECQSSLGDGEGAAQAMLGGSGGCAATAFFQSFVQIRASGLERGDESEGKGDENDHGDRKEEDAEVHADAHRL
jgi:hypothetical protein